MIDRYFLDRAKDVINCGGFDIYSRRVEEAMLGNTKVFECALVGAPDAEMGQIPVALAHPDCQNMSTAGGAAT